MSELEVLPPKLEIDINAQLRLRVLAGVLYELTEICGVHMEEDLKRGIIERDVIQTIIISFKGSDDNYYGRIYFYIDWKTFELLVKTDDSTELYKDIDFSNGYCNALDKKLLNVIKHHVEQLKNTHNIETVEYSCSYQDKYLETDEIYRASMKHMNHVPGKKKEPVINSQFTKSLETAFKGMDGILHIKFEYK